MLVPLLSLLLCWMSAPAHAELSPSDNEPGFRVYDILKPSETLGVPNSTGTARATRQGGRSMAQRAALLGKLLVVGKDDLVIGGVTWPAGSNYWFWSQAPLVTGGDPCKGLPRSPLAEPRQPPSFAVMVAVDGTGDAGGQMGADGALPDTSCFPEHAARGPSRVFKAHGAYRVKSALSGTPDGALYRMSLRSQGHTADIGYAFHDPAAANFGEPGRFGWLLAIDPLPTASQALLAAEGLRPREISRYQLVAAAPEGIVDLSDGDVLFFTLDTVFPEEVSGLSTIDLLIR